MDPCVGPKGEDLCHLARGPPKVDFRNIEKQRKQTVRTVEEASKFIKKTHEAATVSGKDKTDMFFDGIKHLTPKHSHMLACCNAHGAARAP
jgi:DNA-binding ferritin-like protein